MEKHPDKTFIGRIERGFDFLGYHFSLAGLSMAKKTIENFIEKASRLYEQKRRAGSIVSPLEMYVRRWLGWAEGGMANEETKIRKTASRRSISYRQYASGSGCCLHLPLPAPAEQTQRAEA
jgi:hypothetical protein